MTLSIVIPCYNESDNIKLILDKLKKAIGSRRDIEVIFVDNGSTDNSSDIFKEMIPPVDSDIFKVCHIKVNQGYGFGITSGLNIAQADILAWTHADMQTDPVDVIKSFDLMTINMKKNIIIKGKRKHRKFIERIFTFGMQIVVYLFLKIYLDDINAQPKVFRREFYENYIKEDAPKDFSLDLFLLYIAKIHNYEIISIPVFFNKRLFGEAKGGGSMRTRFKLIKRTFKYIIELTKNISPEK